MLFLMTTYVNMEKSLSPFRIEDSGWSQIPSLAGVKALPAPFPLEKSDGQPLFLHICCAPCATYPVMRLRQEGFHLSGYWYNPNIHPWMEHEQRRLSLVRFTQRIEMAMIWEPGYEMPHFLRRVAGREGFRRRCETCYEMRLLAVAHQAKQLGFSLFSTTLLISPYQDQDMIRRIGEEAGREHGLDFFFENFRRGWPERGRLSKAFELYRQQYCGCIYSEWERYNRLDIDAILPHEEYLSGSCSP